LIELLTAVSSKSVWTNSLLATAFIGIVPIALLWFIPIVKQGYDEMWQIIVDTWFLFLFFCVTHNHTDISRHFHSFKQNRKDDDGVKEVINHSFLKVLVSFAVGGLLGDVFLHLLPHAKPNAHDDHHTHTHTHAPHDHTGGQSIFYNSRSAYWLFFHLTMCDFSTKDLYVGLYVLAGLMTFFLIEKIARITQGASSHGHSHSHGTSQEKVSKDKAESSKEKSTSEKKKRTSEPVKIGGILNIIADSAHNFTGDWRERKRE
jgi:zinc transporter ZupT